MRAMPEMTAPVMIAGLRKEVPMRIIREYGLPVCCYFAPNCCEGWEGVPEGETCEALELRDLILVRADLMPDGLVKDAQPGQRILVCYRCADSWDRIEGNADEVLL